jgi:hypothetical protein
MRLIRAACCARAVSGHAVAAPPRSVMNSRRLMLVPRGLEQGIVAAQGGPLEGVRSGGVADRPVCLHCGHRAALPRTAAAGQQETLALQQTASLFDHLVGDGQKTGWHGQAERLGGLEVDNEGVLVGTLDRQVPRACALEKRSI